MGVCASENLQSICHDVLGLNYLDGMSYFAADGDAAPLSPSQRRSQKLTCRQDGVIRQQLIERLTRELRLCFACQCFRVARQEAVTPRKGLDPTPKLDRPVGSPSGKDGTPSN